MIQPNNNSNHNNNNNNDVNNIGITGTTTAATANTTTTTPNIDDTTGTSTTSSTTTTLQGNGSIRRQYLYPTSTTHTTTTTTTSTSTTGTPMITGMPTPTPTPAAAASSLMMMMTTTSTTQEAYSPFLNNQLRFSPKLLSSTVSSSSGLGRGVGSISFGRGGERERAGGAGYGMKMIVSSPLHQREQHQHNNSTPLSTGTALPTVSSRRQFFPSSAGAMDATTTTTTTTTSGEVKDEESQQPMDEGYTTTTAATTSKVPKVDVAVVDDEEEIVIDGIPITQLRQLVSSNSSSSSSPLLSLMMTSSSLAIYYSNIIYSKTHNVHDAITLATAYYNHQQYDNCLRILEQQQIILQYTIYDTLYWDTVLLATQALLSKHDYSTLIDMIEDTCRIPFVVTNNYNNNNYYYHHHNDINDTTSMVQLSSPLVDDDIMGWNILKDIITSTFTRTTSTIKNTATTTMNIVHPLALLCYYRGLAYYETGCPLRATTYYQYAICIDCQCSIAYEALLQYHLITNIQAYHMIVNGDTNDTTTINYNNNHDTTAMTTIHFEPHQEWIKALYLARIELYTNSNSASTKQTNDTDQRTIENSIAAAAAGEGNVIHPHTRTIQFDHSDISSIQLLSPIPTLQINTTTTADDSAIKMQHTAMKETPTNDHDDDVDDDNNNIDGSNRNRMNQTGRKVVASTKVQKSNSIQEDVDIAFDDLFTKYKLQNSLQVLIMAVRRSYQRYDWNHTLLYCQKIALLDPLLTDVAYIYIVTLVMLQHKRVLFRLAHDWVERIPKMAQSWFTVGAYYYCIRRYHVAQRHFVRATRIQPQCTEAWIALGCSFAACDESDQALASYRAAHRLSPGEHTSLLYMGMEYIRTNHLTLASHFIQAAYNATIHCGGDPLCLHEMGVLSMQKGDYNTAIQYFNQAIGAISGCGIDASFYDSIDVCTDIYWEPTIYNLGHAYRKCRQYENALLCYNRCLALCPEKFSIYSTLGYTHHLMNHIDTAILYYHKALGIKPDDPFSTDMLSRALSDQISTTNTQTQDIFTVGLDNPLVTTTASFTTTTPSVLQTKTNQQSRLISTPNSIMKSTMKKATVGDINTPVSDDMELDADMSVAS